MYEAFKKLGIPVSITRDSDITLSPSERVKKILSFYGDNPNVIIISNHINAGGGDGAEVIYALRNDSNLADLILEKLKKAGQNVRDSYQRRLPNDTSKDYYFIHRETGTKTMPVIVEYGFLDSKLDDPEQLKNNYENYASAVVGAILEYIIKAEIFTYVVKKGDTLYSIAKEYDTTVDNLIKLNNLATTSLSVVRVERVENRLGHRTRPLERVEEIRERLRAARVADGVEPRVGTQGGHHFVGIVADAPVMELHDPAALRVFPREMLQHRRAEPVTRLRVDRRTLLSGRKDPVELLFGRLRVHRAVESVIGNRAAPRGEVLDARVERLEEIGELRDFEADRALQKLHVAGKRLLVDVERLVRTERRQDLHFARLVRGDLLVPYERVARIVRRADELHVGLPDDPADAHRLLRENLVAFGVDPLRGPLVQRLGDAEVVLEPEVRPVVEGIADETRQRLRPREERPERIRVLRARDVRLRNPAGPHLAPLVVVAAEPDFGNRLVLLVLRDVLRIDVAMVVDDRHLRRVLVVELLRGRRLQQEILVQKLLHTASIW